MIDAMKRLPRTLIAIAVLAAAALAAALQERIGEHAPAETERDVAVPRAAPPVDRSGYYLVALSWSPTYCESNPDDREQCGRRGYGFVLHGLWPQYEGGGAPRDCSTSQAPDRATVDRALAFMPSRKLVQHQWRAHGSCSGLDPAGYFAESERAFASIRIPPAFTPGARPSPMRAEAIRAAFVEANPTLRTDMLAVTCRSRDLAEVRVCVDRDLSPRRCGRDVGMRCPRDAAIRIPVSR